MQRLTEILRTGHRYQQEWPMHKSLYAVFPDCRIISATQFAARFMPPVAVVVVVIQLSFLGVSHLPQILATALFFISLPFQGWFWLGKRAKTPLPAATRAWYQDIYTKCAKAGILLPKLSARPDYMELAKVMKIAFNNLDNAFDQYV